MRRTEWCMAVYSVFLKPLAAETHQENCTTRGSFRAHRCATVGNVLEWYDFAVYGFLAAIIGKHFFRADDPSASLLASFGVFALGFLNGAWSGQRRASGGI
jgi:hypothetical protein